MKKLSICIPVYNRKALFEQCLLAACKACIDYSDEVEIVVSDNASEDNLLEVIEIIKRIYPEMPIKYRRNPLNVGAGLNLVKSVEIARGEFCWLIGADDFVIERGVDSILNILRQNSEINFISVGFANLDLSETKPENIDVLIKEKVGEFSNESENSFKVEVWDQLVDPSHNNVLLGSMMCGVFRKSLWDSVDKSQIMASSSYTSLTNTYPHIYIYSKCMIGRPAWYYGYPCVLAGDGYREWAAYGEKSFWQSSLPVIYLKIFPEIIEAYKEGGLEKTQLRKARKWSAGFVGKVFTRYVWHKFVKRRPVMSSEYISTKTILKTYWSVADFYFAPLSAIIKRFWRPFRRLSRDVV